jgi:endonuclease-8
MKGRWRVLARDAPLFGSPWLVLRGDEHVAALWHGPVLELDRGVARRLGPDILSEPPAFEAMLSNLRRARQESAVGDALVDQRLVAGIGNMWKAEGCWRAEVDPWRRLRDVTDEEALAIIHAVRPPMQESVGNGFPKSETLFVYKRTGVACTRCGTKIQARGQGDANRTAYWCPGCQR